MGCASCNNYRRTDQPHHMGVWQAVNLIWKKCCLFASTTQWFSLVDLFYLYKFSYRHPADILWDIRTSSHPQCPRSYIHSLHCWGCKFLQYATSGWINSSPRYILSFCTFYFATNLKFLKFGVQKVGHPLVDEYQDIYWLFKKNIPIRVIQDIACSWFTWYLELKLSASFNHIQVGYIK